jgi:hypothetical protein
MEPFYPVPIFPLLRTIQGPTAPLGGPLVCATRAPSYGLLENRLEGGE